MIGMKAGVAVSEAETWWPPLAVRICIEFHSNGSLCVELVEDVEGDWVSVRGEKRWHKKNAQSTSANCMCHNALDLLCCFGDLCCGQRS